MFSLVCAVVSVQPGAAAMTECGLIPALLNVVQLNMDGQVGTFTIVCFSQILASGRHAAIVHVTWMGRYVFFFQACSGLACGDAMDPVV